MYIKRDKTE